MQSKINQNHLPRWIIRLVASAVLICVFALALLNLDLFSADAQDNGGGTEAVANLQDADGNFVGTVLVTTQAGKAVVIAQLSDLPPGFHGFHIHAVGSCEDMDEGQFGGAGDHLNPSGADHPNHAGDLPSVLVMDDGTAFLSVATDRFTVADLFDEDGSAIIIHADEDNFANIPERLGEPDDEAIHAGDAGMPIACGVFEERVIPSTPTPTATAPVDMTATPTEGTPMPTLGTETATPGTETPIPTEGTPVDMTPTATSAEGTPTATPTGTATSTATTTG